jgi:hypothetical protein
MLCFQRLCFRLCLAIIAVMFTLSPALAQEKMPDFGSTVPDQWTVDRYAPDSFQLVNGFEGRDNVLSIGISGDDRPAPYNTMFYNTNGMKYSVDSVGTSSLPSTLSADLFVPDSWADATNGLRRTDIWARITPKDSDAEALSLYYILGFTNESGTGLFRWWTDAAGWQDLGATVQYGAWNKLSMGFATDVFQASINGDLAASVAAPDGANRMSGLIAQAYSFDDSFIGSDVNPAYTANWSNSPTTTTPEPVSMALLGTGLIGVVVVKRKRRKQGILAA